MNTLTEIPPAELTVAAASLTWTGIQPDFVLTTENAATLLAYCSGLASAAIWAAVDIGVWRRNKLRQQYTLASDAYNEAVNSLYAELSRRFPSVQSAISWRSYLSVGERIAYSDRVEGAGPSVYIPALSLSPDAWDSFVLAVQEGTHTDFLAQLWGKPVGDRSIASTNGYGPHADDSVPFSASAPGVYADADEAVQEYERDTGHPTSPDNELLEEVVYLLRYAKFYCQDPYSDEEDEFWAAESNRCDVAIDKIKELLR